MVIVEARAPGGFMDMQGKMDCLFHAADGLGGRKIRNGVELRRESDRAQKRDEGSGLKGCQVRFACLLAPAFPGMRRYRRECYQAKLSCTAVAMRSTPGWLGRLAPGSIRSQSWVYPGTIWDRAGVDPWSLQAPRTIRGRSGCSSGRLLLHIRCAEAVLRAASARSARIAHDGVELLREFEAAVWEHGMLMSLASPSVGPGAEATAEIAMRNAAEAARHGYGAEEARCGAKTRWLYWRAGSHRRFGRSGSSRRLRSRWRTGGRRCPRQPPWAQAGDS